MIDLHIIIYTPNKRITTLAISCSLLFHDIHAMVFFADCIIGSLYWVNGIYYICKHYSFLNHLINSFMSISNIPSLLKNIIRDSHQKFFYYDPSSLM